MSSKKKETNTKFMSIDELIENTHEQIRAYQSLNFNQVYTRCQEELQCWHAAAVAHLGQIYSQRLADLAQVYTQDVCPESEKFKQKMIEQLKTRIMPKIAKILDDPEPDPGKIERMQTLLSHIRSECEMMLNRQWIRIQLPNMKTLSIPIKIKKTDVKCHFVEHEKDLFADFNDDQSAEKPSKSSENENQKKRKCIAIDPVDLFHLYPEPIKYYSLGTNSSTLSLSDHHILLHDHPKLILYDYQQKIHEFHWSDNQYGILVDICWMSSLSIFIVLTINSVYLYDPSKAISTPTYVPMKIDCIQPLERTHIFASITSLDRDIYINYHKGIHIDQYRVSSTLQWNLEKRYAKSDCCESTDIGVRDIRCDGQFLCLSVMQQNDFKWRLDLMTRDLTRIRRGIPMDSGENQHKFFSMTIPLYDQRWIFVNWFTNKLWLVDQQGKTRLMKETRIKNVRNVSISPNRCYMIIRMEKPSFIKFYKLD